MPDHSFICLASMLFGKTVRAKVTLTHWFCQMGLDSFVLAHLLHHTRKHVLAVLGSSSSGFKCLTLGHLDSGSQETIQFWIQMLDIIMQPLNREAWRILCTYLYSVMHGQCWRQVTKHGIISRCTLVYSPTSRQKKTKKKTKQKKVVVIHRGRYNINKVKVFSLLFRMTKENEKKSFSREP